MLCGGDTEPVLADIFDVRFGAPGHYEVRRCGKCGVEQTTPRLSAGLLQEAYEKYYNFRVEDTEDYVRRRAQMVRTRIVPALGET